MLRKPVAIHVVLSGGCCIAISDTAFDNAQTDPMDMTEIPVDSAEMALQILFVAERLLTEVTFFGLLMIILKMLSVKSVSVRPTKRAI